MDWVSVKPAMSRRDYHNVEFWKRAPNEEETDWCQRVLYEGILHDVDGDDGGTNTLNRFLSDDNSDVRTVALEACFGAADLALDDTVELILKHLSDSSPKLRLLALRCCRHGFLETAGPVLLKLLSEDSALRRDFEGSGASDRPTVRSEAVAVLELLDVKESAPLLAKLGVSSEYLNRDNRRKLTGETFPAAMEGEFVETPGGDTEILPAQDLDHNPACPECERPLYVLLTTAYPHGPKAPEGMEGVPFFRCLGCYAHSPCFVRVTSPVSCLGEMEVTEGSGPEGLNPGAHGWSVKWARRQEEPQEEEPYGLFLGGHADWVQEDDTPTCPLCDQRMAFVFQVPGEAGEFPFVQEGGELYGFWCHTCTVSATMQQVS